MNLKTLLLAPVVLGQALWVVARATRLPEPAGPRHGTIGNGPPLRLLVLGDSSAAGVGVEHQRAALATQLAADLGQSFQVTWHLCAKSGATTASTLRTLETLPRQGFDVVLVVLGVNDTKNGVSYAAWTRRYNQLLDTLERDFQAGCIFLSGLPPIRHFPLLPWPLRDVLGDRATRFDMALRGLAAARANTVFIPLGVTLDKEGMSEDGFHPGPAIYADWAAGVAWFIRNTLHKPDA